MHIPLFLFQSYDLKALTSLIRSMYLRIKQMSHKPPSELQVTLLLLLWMFRVTSFTQEVISKFI